MGRPTPELLLEVLMLVQAGKNKTPASQNFGFHLLIEELKYKMHSTKQRYRIYEYLFILVSSLRYAALMH